MSKTLIGLITHETVHLAALPDNGEKRSVTIGTRKVDFVYSDGSIEPKSYDRNGFGNSGNTLFVADVGHGRFEVALNIEFKPGLVDDNTDTRNFAAKVIALPSGRQVTIPYGATATIFGGYYKPNEDAMAGALRELKEESGFDAVTFNFLGRFMLKPAWTNASDDMFLAFGERQQSFAAADDISIAKRVWVTLEDAYVLFQTLAGFGEDAVADTMAHYPAMMALNQALVWLAAKGLIDFNAMAGLVMPSREIAAA